MSNHTQWLAWIARWGYSAPAVYNRLFHMPATSTTGSAVCWRAARKGILAVQRTAIHSAPLLYSLGDRAALHLRSKAQGITPSQLSHHARRPTLLHDLAVQAFAAAMPGGQGAYKPVGRVNAVVPDAIVPTPNGAIALEVETTQKSVSRIYRSFLAHAAALARGDYARVLYVFPDDHLAASYRSRFSAIEWPSFAYVPARRRYEPHGPSTTVPLEHPIRARFAFEVHTLWPFPR